SCLHLIDPSCFGTSWPHGHVSRSNLQLSEYAATERSEATRPRPTAGNTDHSYVHTTRVRTHLPVHRTWPAAANHCGNKQKEKSANRRTPAGKGGTCSL